MKKQSEWISIIGLHLRDILKKATGSKPDVALVWFMQCMGKDGIGTWEKDRYLCII